MNPFFAHFMVTTFASSFGILFILLAKKLLKSHISARWQYNLNLLFFILLALPFIPRNFFSSISLSIPRLDRLQATYANTTTITGVAAVPAYDGGWLQDFAIPTAYSESGYIWLVLMGIWIAGMIILATVMLFCNRNLRLIKESVKPVKDKEILSIFSRCKAEIGVKNNILLGSSILVKTPMTTGFFQSLIVLPSEKISPSSTRYAILHELAHCKNKDIQVNGLICLFQILYWFNPLVYLIFKQTRLDRELACDASVLDMLPKTLHTDYGTTLLNFVSTLSRPSLLFGATGMGGSKPQIIQRVKHIASYSTDTALLKAKSICLSTLMGLIVLCQIPLISVLANSDDSRFHFQANNVLYKDLSPFFDGIEGGFVLYDLETGLYTIHNRDMCVTRVSPFSTYKIFSALIALEQGVLEADNTLREWDGTIHPFEAWNQDHSLISAMRNSVNWYFQDFDKMIGIETLHYYLTRLSYGNRNLSGDIASFWNGSSLRISPLEQVILLRYFYQNNTIFEAKHVNTLKDALRLSERDGVMLSGKTGTGSVNDWATSSYGWFIGYVENDGRTSIFATYIQGEENAGGSMAAQITLSILEDKGIYP